MKRSLPPRAGLFLGAALCLSLAGCGQGIGPGLTAPSTDAPARVTETDAVAQTLDEVTTQPSSPPTEEPTGSPAEELTGAPIEAATTPGLSNITVGVPRVVRPAPEDCVGYDPANLTVTAYGDAWLLRDGGHQMKLFDTAADAEDARRVARNWRQLCFIGRANTGPDRYRHIITYFKEPSRLPVGPAPTTLECIPYDPADLDLYQGPFHPADPDNHYWMLYSGPTPLLELDNQADALRAEIVASNYTRLCFIGAGNHRPDPYRYQMEWWRS